jgi:hypothetical protein
MGGLNNIQLQDEEKEVEKNSADQKLQEEEPPEKGAPKTPVTRQKFKIRAGSTSPLNKDGIGKTRWEEWSSTKKTFGSKKYDPERKNKRNALSS